MADFARYYGTILLPTQPCRPEHKGKIEVGVKYAQSNALKRDPEGVGALRR